MLHKLIATLRKRGAQGRVFPVQAAEAAQAAELIAGLVAQRDELLKALDEVAFWTEKHTPPGHPITAVARSAIAKATGEKT